MRQLLSARRVRKLGAVVLLIVILLNVYGCLDLWRQYRQLMVTFPADREDLPRVHVVQHNASHRQATGLFIELDTFTGDVKISASRAENDSASASVLRDQLKSQIESLQHLFICDRSLNLIDIGFGIGVMTIIAAQYDRDVIAVDASRSNVHRLLITVANNEHFSKKVTVVNNAVSHRRTTIRDSSHHEDQSALFDQEELEHLVSEGESDTNKKPGDTDAILMDDLLPIVTEKFRRAFLRINLKSSLYEALLQSRLFFEELEIPYVLMNWHLKLWGHEAKAHGIIKYLLSLGYRAFDDVINVTALEDRPLEKWPREIVWIKTGEPRCWRKSVDKG